MMAGPLADIKTKEDGKGVGEHDQICGLCLRDFAKYTCPRCNVRYCSLSCYRDKKHLQCSESFYRESFITELQQRKGSAEEKRRMLEALRRLEEEEEEEEMEGAGESLAYRIAGLDLDTEADVVWERLTPEERRQFNHLLQSGKLGHLLDVYTPWWEVSQHVVFLEGGKGRGGETVPEVLLDLPPLNTLIQGGQASPAIQYSVLSVLYAYAYTVRLFNGWHYDLPLQASEAIVAISPCLSSNISFSSAGEALQVTMATVQQKPKLWNSQEFSCSVLEDISHILSQSRSHDCRVTRALSDLHRLLAAARTQLKATSGKDSPVDSGSKQLWQVKKKVYFFTVWSRENCALLPLLATLVDAKKALALRARSEYEGTKAEVTGARVNSEGCGIGVSLSRGECKLIEELS